MNNQEVFEVFFFLLSIVVVALCVNELIRDYRERNEANANNRKFRSTDGE